DDDLLRDLPENRDAKSEPIDHQTTSLELPNQLDRDKEDERHQRYRPEILHAEITGVDQGQGDRGKLHTEVREDLLELGNDPVKDEEQDGHGDRDDDDRVNHRTDD